jgi:CheY-like chemotaxis protein
VKAGIPAGHLLVPRLYALDAGARRAVPDVALEPFDRLDLPFGFNLDTTVRGVADPPLKPFARCRSLSEEAKAHALNAPADEVVPGRSHDRKGNGIIVLADKRKVPLPVRAPECPVLIVEDDADLREMMAQLLTLEGYAAQTVANGRDALSYLEQGHHPDLILLDLMMPIMDGWEFRRRQRDNPSLAHVPVVVLSALDQARAADLGGAAFLKKPLDFDRLLELVRQYCSHPA